MRKNLTHTQLPETDTPPALAVARLEVMISHALSHPQQAAVQSHSATVIAIRRHAWTTGLLTAGFAAAIMLAVLPGNFDHLANRSTITSAGLSQTAQTANPDALDDISDMLTLNTLDSYDDPSTDDSAGI